MLQCAREFDGITHNILMGPEIGLQLAAHGFGGMHRASAAMLGRQTGAANAGW
jgi:hypothetical protein